jgi:uncharacterized membrane protein YbhN (UPF0104 family)
MMSKVVGRCAAVATIVVFCVAIAILLREFASISPREVLARLAALPTRQISAAIGLTTTSYLLLTGYDFLALHYVGHKLRFRDVVFASFISFAFSNSVGLQFLSGGSVRYRIYSGFGLTTVAIGEIVAFCTFTYALGIVTVGGLVALIGPGEAASLLHIPPSVISVFGFVLLAFGLAYPAVAAVWRKPIALGPYQLRPPSLTLAVSQVVLASVDAILAGTVMYVLLPADFGITFRSFLDVYLVAATASVLSSVPGGFGVFETIVAAMTPPTSKAAELTAFLAYRMVYFVGPVTVAILWFTVHELLRRPGKQITGSFRSDVRRSAHVEIKNRS